MHCAMVSSNMRVLNSLAKASLAVMSYVLELIVPCQVRWLISALKMIVKAQSLMLYMDHKLISF